MALTFIGLGALEVATPPPYVFLIRGLLSTTSNCPLLMVSSIEAYYYMLEANFL